YFTITSTHKKAELVLISRDADGAPPLSRDSQCTIILTIDHNDKPIKGSLLISKAYTTSAQWHLSLLWAFLFDVPCEGRMPNFLAAVMVNVGHPGRRHCVLLR
ncbi:hypothetical protein CVS40_8715, partial [Lucilia cuprina]